MQMIVKTEMPMSHQLRSRRLEKCIFSDSASDLQAWLCGNHDCTVLRLECVGQFDTSCQQQTFKSRSFAAMGLKERKIWPEEFICAGHHSCSVLLDDTIPDLVLCLWQKK